MRRSSCCRCPRRPRTLVAVYADSESLSKDVAIAGVQPARAGRVRRPCRLGQTGTARHGGCCVRFATSPEATDVAGILGAGAPRAPTLRCSADGDEAALWAEQVAASLGGGWRCHPIELAAGRAAAGAGTRGRVTRLSGWRRSSSPARAASAPGFCASTLTDGAVEIDRRAASLRARPGVERHPSLRHSRALKRHGRCVGARRSRRLRLLRSR